MEAVEIRTSNVSSELLFDYMESPLGELELCANDLGLVSLLFTETEKGKLAKHKISGNFITHETKAQLNAYFEGSLREFDRTFRSTPDASFNPD